MRCDAMRAMHESRRQTKPRTDGRTDGRTMVTMVTTTTTSSSSSSSREVVVRLLNDPDECVVVNLDALPRDAEDVATALQAELAPLHAWIDVCEEYLRRGDHRGFEAMMEMVCAPGTCVCVRARARATRRVGVRRRAG